MFQKKKLLSLIVSLSLLCSGLLAAEPVDDPSATDYCWGDGKMFEKYDASKEDLSRRDMSSKHFRNDNGSYTAAIIAGPVHYLNDAGEWREINSRIIETESDPSYKFCNETNNFKTYYPEISNDAAGVKFIYKNGDVNCWRDVRISWTDRENIEHRLSDIHSSNAKAIGNRIVFENSFDGINVEFKVTNTGLKRNLIFKRFPHFLHEIPRGSLLNIVEKISLADGCYIEVDGQKQTSDFSTDTRVEIKNANGNGAFITPPIIKDASDDKWTTQKVGSLQFKFIGDDVYCYTQIPVEWLRSGSSTDYLSESSDATHTSVSSDGDDSEGELLEIMASTTFYPNDAANWVECVAFLGGTYYGYPMCSGATCGGSCQPFAVSCADAMFGTNRSAVQFNISSLPGGSDVTQATVRFHIWQVMYESALGVNYYHTNTATCGSVDSWTLVSCSYMFNTCIPAGTAYNTNVAWPTWASAWTPTTVLGGTANNDIEAAIASGYFAISCVGNSGTDIKQADDGWNSPGTNPPQLTVTYTEPCSEPATQASNVTFSNVQSCGMTVSWTNGSGTGRAVFMKQTTTGTAAPADGTAYTANTVFGSGSQIGSTGWYCIYNSTGTSVSVTGLSASTTYRVHVCEYDCTPINYNANSGTDNPDNQASSAMSYGTVASGDESICSGGDPSNITMSSAPTGSGSFSYQWYYQDGLPACPSGSSTSGWTSIGGATGSSYNPPSGLTTNRTYAVFITPGGSPTCGTVQWASSCRKVTVNNPPSITGHPSNSTIGEGENTSFSVSATGAGLTYQWQVNTGSGWNNITAAGADPVYANWTTATLQVNLVVSGNDGYQYRCVVTGTCSPAATSNAATLYVTSDACDVPRTMNYQAKLTNLGGTALEDSDRKMAFLLYNISTGGTPLWAETLSVNLVSGLFDVQLGTVHPIDLDFCEPYWIQMKIDGNDDGDVVDDPDDELMTPREKLAPVGYAFRSIYSDTAAYVSGGGSSTTTTSGEYAGNSTVNRAVPHGLGRTPNAVLIFAWGSTWYRIFAPYPGTIHYMDASAQGGYAVTAMDATNFYVGSSSDYHLSANLSLEAYIWIAF